VVLPPPLPEAAISKLATRAPKSHPKRTKPFG
jgi:hypothetical protein